MPCNILIRTVETNSTSVVRRGYQYADCPLSGGTAKISRLRSIEGEKGKKKNKKRKRKKKKNTLCRPRPHAVIARGSPAGDFSLAGGERSRRRGKTLVVATRAYTSSLQQSYMGMVLRIPWRLSGSDPTVGSATSSVLRVIVRLVSFDVSDWSSASAAVRLRGSF
ncbi:hypothetical protein BHE74_00008058 [Ensete ventricosum]|nr:hypothetical protein BHE74_00008058 [Ensete ventricosum]